MNKQNTTTAILVLGTLILCIFSCVVAVNILPDNVHSESYFSKIDSEMLTKIDKIEMKNGKLEIYTIGNNASICVKTTKSIPKHNSLCWINAKENIVTTSVYQNKNYYIWIKDEKGNISSRKKNYTN